MFRSGDYRETLRTETEKLWKAETYELPMEDGELMKIDVTDRTTRMWLVETLCEMYFQQTGEQPDPRTLDMMGDLCLQEELTDRNPHKMSHDAYPIMSSHQVALRRDRTAPMIAAVTVGSDKVDHRKPIRRNMSTKRMVWLDEKSQIRNQERRDQYKQDTAPGVVLVTQVNVGE